MEPWADFLSVSKELLVLLPHVALELQFVGDSLPHESDQQHFTMQRVRARGGPTSPALSLVAWWDPPLSLHLPLFFLGPPLITRTFSGFPTPLPAPQDGPEVSVRPNSGASGRLSSGTKEKGGRRDLQIRVSTRPYHLLQGPKPDLVIGKSLGLKGRDLGKVKEGHCGHQCHPLSLGFNSGFGLKDTWLSSLPRLQVDNHTHPAPSLL